MVPICLPCMSPGDIMVTIWNKNSCGTRVLGVPKLTCDKKTKKGKVACDKEIGMPKRREREREREREQNGDGHWGWYKTQDFPQEWNGEGRVG